MSWADSVKATALAVLAERAARPARNVADAPYSWNAYDVWLSRVRHSRDVAVQTSMTDAITQLRQGTANRD